MVLLKISDQKKLHITIHNARKSYCYMLFGEVEISPYFSIGFYFHQLIPSIFIFYGVTSERRP
jgi:hypothetical protein